MHSFFASSCLIDCSMFDEIQRFQLINNSTFVLFAPCMASRQNGRKFEGDVTEGGFEEKELKEESKGFREIPRRKLIPRPTNDVTSLQNTSLQITFFSTIKPRYSWVYFFAPSPSHPPSKVTTELHHCFPLFHVHQAHFIFHKNICHCR
jgi:hypothetical protein